MNRETKWLSGFQLKRIQDLKCAFYSAFVWVSVGCSSFLPPQTPYVDITNISATALDQGFGLRSGVGPLVLHCALPTAPKEIPWDKYRQKLPQADQLSVTQNFTGIVRKNNKSL